MILHTVYLFNKRAKVYFNFRQLPIRSCLSPAQGAETNGDGVVLDDDKMQQVVSIESSVAAFLTSLQLEHLIELFEREQITMDILAEMGHEDLKQVGVSAYGFRHKILKGIVTLRATTGIALIVHGRRNTS